jgi:hypothetical protein
MLNYAHITFARDNHITWKAFIYFKFGDIASLRKWSSNNHVFVPKVYSQYGTKLGIQY